MTSDRDLGNQGFTLIEVLVALAIIAFGLIAAFGQLNQSATAAARLRDRTFAHWVAMNRLTELRLAGAFPAAGTQSDDVDMANQRWHYEIRIAETEDERLRRADVTVSTAEQPDRPLATAVGFLMEPAQASGLAQSARGWPRLSADGRLREESPAPQPAPAPGNNEAESR